MHRRATAGSAWSKSGGRGPAGRLAACSHMRVAASRGVQRGWQGGLQLWLERVAACRQAQLTLGWGLSACTRRQLHGRSTCRWQQGRRHCIFSACAALNTGPQRRRTRPASPHQPSPPYAPVAGVRCYDGPGMLPLHRLCLFQPPLELLLQQAACRHSGTGGTRRQRWR